MTFHIDKFYSQQGNALKEIQEIATHCVEIVAHKSLDLNDDLH